MPLTRPLRPPLPEPEAASFYHLVGTAVEPACCQGTACFAARDLDPGRWKAAVARDKRVYCLGRCYASPSSGRDETRPIMEVKAREPVIMRWLSPGAAKAAGGWLRHDGYQALRSARGRSGEEIVVMLERSRLRGRGGAGFPTGRKWRAVLERPGRERFVVANADEGDPGAYIDRLIIEEDPHVLIEGLAIAGHAVGARKGYVYLRKEYPRAGAVLRAALDEARRDGVLGAFSIELVEGEGSYVCGEETALLNSLEGRRPIVRARPPYPTEKGLFAKPTAVNNVETLASVPWIVTNGPQRYAAMGFSESRGTKLVSLNSLFRRPGLYEVDFGVTVRHIVETIGGGLKTGALKGVLIGGPLAGVLPPSLLDTPFGFEELRAVGAGVGHGGIVAFDENTSIRELAEHVFSFAAYESCGECTPCRLGSRRVERLLAGGEKLDAAEWEDVAAALKQTSLCGLGGGLGEFAESLRLHYPQEVASWLE